MSLCSCPLFKDIRKREKVKIKMINYGNIYKSYLPMLTSPLLL